MLGPGGRTVFVGDEGFTVRAPDRRVVARVRLDIRSSRRRSRGRLTADDSQWSATAPTRMRANWWSSTPTPVLSCCAARGSRAHTAGLQPGRLGAARQGRATGPTPRARWRRDDPASRVGSGVLRRHGPGRDHLGPADPVISGTAVRVAAERLGAPLWGADGMLAYVVSGAPEGCAYPSDGLGLLVGGRSRMLVEPAGRELRLALWSPDRRRLAVDSAPRSHGPAREAPAVAEARCARLRDVQPARGCRDAPIALRASRALRRGGTRTDVLRRVRLDFDAAAQRFDEAQDTAVVRGPRQRARSLAGRGRLAAARCRRRGQLLRSAAVS